MDQAKFGDETRHPNLGTPNEPTLAALVRADLLCRRAHPWHRARLDLTQPHITYRGRRLLACDSCRTLTTTETP